MSAAGWARAAVTIILIAGCSGAPTARNNLAGRVLLDGNVINDGIVTLHGPGSAEAISSIRVDGTYSIDDPPLGICQITVRDVPSGDGGPVAHGEQPKSQPSRIPAKYERTGNGLQVEVKPGQHSHDIALSR